MTLLTTCVLFVTVIYSCTAYDIVGKCDDSSCPKGQRCVLDRVQCFRAPCPPVQLCVDDPKSGIRPGNCPAERPDTFGICVVQCFGDGSCPGDQKCCGNCPRACAKPVNLPTKPGRCPPRLLGFFKGWCKTYIDLCTYDEDCRGLHRCCNTGCGNRCTRPYPELPIFTYN